jgi:hypothetical protein
MRKQSTKWKLGWVCLSLLLLVMPMQPAWGQETLPGDEPVTVEATMEVEPPLNEAEEEIVAVDEAALSQQLFLPMVQQSGEADAVHEEQDEENADVSAAFTQSWSVFACQNVPNGQFGLWDDIPGTDSDAALLWFLENDAINETCTYYTLVPGGVLTSNFQQLRMRVAVGDGARFTIRLFRYAGNTCNTDAANLLREYTTPATADHNRYIIYNVTLPAGYSVCRVGMSLTDDPDNSAATRTSALIDYIQIRNPTTGAIAWQESFENAN